MQNIIKHNKTETISINIDGKTVTVPAGITVLHAAQKAGIYIPTLCYLEHVIPFGGCRLCMVEIKNMRAYPTACTTPIAQDMEISTKTPELQKLRREILELILSEHPYTCLVCRDKNNCNEFMTTTRKVSVTTGCNFCTNNGNCELQELVEYLELTEIRYPWTYKEIKPEKNNPFYDIDYNLCILCGRCVRVCNEIRHSEVLNFVQRGNLVIVGTAFGESQKDAGCEFCGACIDVCPTGSLSEKMGKWAGIPDKSTETTCVFCSVACKMNINTKDNRIVNVGPEPGKRTNPLQLCVRGKFVPGDIMHHPERITTPMLKKENKWIEVTWDEAINFTVNKLEQYRGNQFGIIGSAHESLENNYVLQKFSRKLMKSNNVDILSSFPDKNIIKKIHDYYTHHKPANIDDITNADTIFVIGSQTNLSHPIIENRIRKAAKNGKKVIVANTHDTRTSYFAEQNILYKQGEEHTFLLSLLSVLNNKILGKLSNDLKQEFKGFDIEKAFKQCGVSRQDIEKIAKSLANSKKPVIIAGDGILINPDSIFNFNALVNIQTILKKPDACKIIFLLNEGNFYGSILAGMHPDFLPGFDELASEKNIKKWSDNWNAELNNYKGLSGNEMVNNITEDGITALFVVGDIPAHPNLAKLKFLAQQNMFLTEVSEYAHVFFPITGFTEINGHIINLEQKLKEITLVTAPAKDVKTVWETISNLARVMQEKGFDYKKPEDIFSEINSFIDLSFATEEKAKNEILPVRTDVLDKKKKLPVEIIAENNYFNYLGNDLLKLIPDMRDILG